MLTTAITVNGL